MTAKNIRHLLISNKRDITTDFIVRELNSRNLSFFRLNTEDIPKLSVLQNSETHTTQLTTKNAVIDLGEIKSAYFRRPLPPAISSEVDLSIRQYQVDEWSYLLRSIYLEIGDKWFSHPNNIILAEDKPKQLRRAQTLGFNVPETVITNDVQAVKGLFEGGNVIAKPLHHALITKNAKESVIFTSDIKNIDDINPASLSLAPVIFQRKITKQFDVRVTVVGKQVFAVTIDSQSHSRTRTDWRLGEITSLEHTPIELPTKLNNLCIEIVHDLGLSYGAIDFVLDMDGKYWFLECNPNGQWAWIENRTGLPIAKAIVDMMEEKCSS